MLLSALLVRRSQRRQPWRGLCRLRLPPLGQRELQARQSEDGFRSLSVFFESVRSKYNTLFFRKISGTLSKNPIGYAIERRLLGKSVLCFGPFL
ncbi:hypothetical protein Fuma_01664 [Fuerstiella marisgermanici]|uniref:Uncharacterized protein n=1 Tax=Fuerstiella marisgermanici TaxID=1891926 RepID=A0A1P8WDC7_9PLAN|nr:hypothetical protein Fuma_01664 [Fuerstiella marisgermanici]